MPATFDRLGGFSGGVSLDEPLLPASSLTRNTRNTAERLPPRHNARADVPAAPAPSDADDAPAPPAQYILCLRVMYASLMQIAAGTMRMVPTHTHYTRMVLAWHTHHWRDVVTQHLAIDRDNTTRIFSSPFPHPRHMETPYYTTYSIPPITL